MGKERGEGGDEGAGFLEGGGVGGGAGGVRVAEREARRDADGHVGGRHLVGVLGADDGGDDEQELAERGEVCGRELAKDGADVRRC